MKTDIYTKLVLTVIALALTINLIKDFTFVTSAQANTTELPTLVKAKRDTIDVNIVQLNGQDIFVRSLKVREGGERAVFPISLEYHDLLSPLDVNLQLIKGDNIYAPENYSSTGSYRGRMLGVMDPYQ